MWKVTVEAPTRVDLIGGTLDIYPLFHLLDSPKTINVGVNLNAKVVIRNHDNSKFRITSLDQNIEIMGSYDEIVDNRELPLFGQIIQGFWKKEWPSLSIESDCLSPAGAGLGGSSCLAVSIASGLEYIASLIVDHERVTDEQLVSMVQNVETKLIHCPTGCQDYWGAMRGRINILSFEIDGVKVETLEEQDFTYLKERLILCFSGKSRDSGINNWSIFKKVFDKDFDLLNKLNQISRLARDAEKSIKIGDWKDFFRISEKEWELRKTLWPEIETIETKQIELAARRAGANFARVCGAGGGGVMAIFAERHQHDSIKRQVEAVGGNILDSTISSSGLTITVQEN